MKEPLVSVVMPSYNSEKHIAESIQSIINQTFTDWEFIIVDGHSKDKTIEIIQSFMAKDSRIKLIFDEGKGIGPALNMGCVAARGKYIARMDTDDISLPERIEIEFKYMETHPGTVMVSSSAQYINERGEHLGYMFPYTHQHHLKRNISIVHPSVMMIKDTFMQCGGYPPIKRAEDLMLWYKMIRKGKLKIMEYPYIKYRLSDSSLVNSMTESFSNEVALKWKKYANNDILSSKDLDEINRYINDNITETYNRVDPVNKVENSLLVAFRYFLPFSYAIKCVFVLKNLYGYIK